MLEVLVPQETLAGLYDWALHHPKLYVVDRTNEPTNPVKWADEHLVVNHTGRLLVKVAGRDDEVKQYDGDLTYTKRQAFNTQYLMGMYVVYHENGEEHRSLRFEVHRPIIDKLILTQTKLNNTGEKYEPVEPDLDGFLGHVAAITSVADFDWTEAEAQAAAWRAVA